MGEVVSYFSPLFIIIFLESNDGTSRTILIIF